MVLLRSVHHAVYAECYPCLHTFGTHVHSLYNGARVGVNGKWILRQVLNIHSTTAPLNPQFGSWGGFQGNSGIKLSFAGWACFIYSHEQGTRINTSAIQEYVAVKHG